MSAWHGRLARDPGEDHGRPAGVPPVPLSPHPALSPEYDSTELVEVRGEGCWLK
jgi:hypothetical protein